MWGSLVFETFGQYYKWTDTQQFSSNSLEIGKSDCFFRQVNDYKPSIYWSRACELDPSLDVVGWPRRDADAEKFSYKLQCDKHVLPEDRYQPSMWEIQRIMNKVLPKYKKHFLPEFWKTCDFFMAIEDLKKFIKPDATPGVPYTLMANRNDQLLNILGTRFNDMVIDRIHRRLEFDPHQLELMSPEQLVDLGLCDPVRVFVKGEPHKIKKLKEGRVRLIHSVSIVDKMIEMLLMRHFTKLEISNWKDIPSKPGIGFTESDCQCVYDCVVGKPVRMRSSDVEGWDWNVDKWQIKTEAERKIQLCKGFEKPEFLWDAQLRWADCMRLNAVITCKSVYQFSDGVMVKNKFEGIVNSGKYDTSCGNSGMRSFLAASIGADEYICAGDDTVEEDVCDAVEKYREYGYKIKTYDLVDNSFEFCSRIYENGKSWPINKEKILFNLLHNIPGDDYEHRLYLTGFVDDMQHHPQYLQIMELIEQVGYLELAGAQVEILGNEPTTSTSTIPRGY